MFKNRLFLTFCGCLLFVVVVVVSLAVAWVAATWQLRNNCLDYGNPPDECRDLTIYPF